MRYTVDIHRYSPEIGVKYIQSFYYDTDEPSESVATLLTELNRRPELTDITGAPAEPVMWQCSCLQQKCGACAMVINGRPALACKKRLSECGEHIELSPLQKFPAVSDLMADRSIMCENLKALKLWFEDAVSPDESSVQLDHDASLCLQCGCCLEICPNWSDDGTFTGMAGAVPAARILNELPDSQKKELSGLYRRKLYEGCGKSLACRDICPAGIDTDRLLVNSNAAAVWKRFRKKGRVKRI